MDERVRCEICGSQRRVTLFGFRILCAKCRKGVSWGACLRRGNGGAASRKRDRRAGSRGQSFVLVRCEPCRRRGASESIEMWASEISAKGLRLTWSQPWVCGSCSHRLWWRAAASCTVETCPFMPKDEWLRPGRRVLVRNLLFGDKGNVPVTGTVVWKRKSPDQRRWEVGVRCRLAQAGDVDTFIALKDLTDVVLEN